MVALLAGGSGGAKLARGLLDVVGASELVVVANTADDIEVHGVHVSPDPDLVCLWLADLIDARGYGLRGDTWAVMEGLEAMGRPTWFRLGDRDLALCLVRTELLSAGARLTDAQAEVARGLGVSVPVLPMADEPVRTYVRSSGRWRPFQEFMILDRPDAAVEGVHLRGIEAAEATPEVLEALAEAEAVIVAPSNPIISIGPIVATPGVRAALETSAAPVVAVSPFVGGRVLKGPTHAFMAHSGFGQGAAAVVRAYAGLLDGLVADEPVEGLPVLEIDTLMDSPDARERVARRTLEFAHSLAG